MNLTIFTGLVNNAALLFTIALLYDLLEIKTQEKRSLIRQYLAGLIIGIAGIVIMLNPLDFGNGVIFDTRSVLLCVAGLFFGPVPTVTSMLMVSAFRIYMGGGGLWMGVGVIISSGSIGLVWRHFRNTKKDDPSVGELYLFGLVVHMVMVLWMFILPKNVITAAFAKIAPPVMIIYPLATAVIGKLIINRKKRIQVRDELGKSEEKFRNLFHYHSAVKLLIDPDTGDITDANLAAEKFYGWKVEELKQMHIQDINTIPPDQIKLEIEKVRSSQRTHFEFQHRLADGSVRDVEVYSSRVLVDNKIYLHSIVHDITDRRLAENALLKSKERLNFALHMSKTGGWEMDLTALTITCTREFDRIFGYDNSTITWSYKTFMDHIFNDDKPEVEKSFKQAISEKKDWNFESRIRIAEGDIRWIWVASQHIADDTGKMTHLAGILQDITDRKKAQEEQAKLHAQLVQAQKMESVGRLAGGVAHDFNNMLSVILGYVELILDKVDSSTPMHANLTEIKKAANRSADITRQLLAFARKQTISPKVLDLNETVEGMLKMLQRLIEEDIDLIWKPKAGLWPVKIDPSQLDQILANLCINARDAIAGKGKLIIKTDMVSLNKTHFEDQNEFTPGDYVLMAVSDNGRGMDTDTLSHIFEPFFTTKGIEKGTGLGLATVYGIIKQNNGFIDVQSETDKGTTFKIYLPRYDTALDNKTITKENISGMKVNETVILVEDDPTILNMTTEMLNLLGYKVLTAGNAGEAIKIARTYKNKIHLLITDVVMPDMDGKELSEKIHAIYPGLKILFMSGYTANVIAHRGVLDEGVNFIQKPFSKKTLSKKIQEILQERKIT